MILAKIIVLNLKRNVLHVEGCFVEYNFFVCKGLIICMRNEDLMNCEYRL